MNGTERPASIRELRRIVFDDQKRKIEPVLSTWTYRHVSVFLTWLLVRTPITPNQLTFSGILLGVGGCILLALPDARMGLVGCLVLHVGYLFDCADGEVARYKSLSSNMGVFLDKYSHAILMPALFLAAGVHFYFAQGNRLAFVLVGAVSGYAAYSPSLRTYFTALYFLSTKSKYPQYSQENLERQLVPKRSKKVRSALYRFGRQFFRHATYNYLLTAIWLVNLRRPVLGAQIWVGLASMVILKDLVTLAQIWRQGRIEKTLHRIGKFKP